MKKLTVFIVTLVLIVSMIALVVADGDGGGSSSGGSGGGSGGGSSGGGSSGGSSSGSGGGSSGSGSSGISSGSGSDSSSSSGNIAGEATTTDDASVKTEDTDKTETKNDDGTETKTEVRADGEVRTETSLPDGTKVKTRVEDGKERVDVYQGGVKVRFEREEGRFRVKVEQEDGGDNEVEEKEIVLFEEREDKEQIKVRALGELVLIEKQNTQALTSLPISVDLETNALTVTTPAGEKVLTILPDQAVQNMLAANVIDRIGGEELVKIVRDNQANALAQVVGLAERKGVPIYEVKGLRDRKLFGFIPITTKVDVQVSAETGEVVQEDRSFLNTIAEALSTDPAPAEAPPAAQ